MHISHACIHKVPLKAFIHSSHLLQTIRHMLCYCHGPEQSRRGSCLSNVALISLKMVRFTNRNHRWKAEKLPYLKICEIFMRKFSCTRTFWPSNSRNFHVLQYIVACQGSGVSIKAAAQHMDKRYPCPFPSESKKLFVH